MQHNQTEQWEEHGCSVWRAVKQIEVRRTIDVEDDTRTGTWYNVGDLISVDLVRPSRFSASTNGPFLRLTDCSGWLFEHKYSERYMERVTVEDGMWDFYADNVPAGIALRWHPFDGSSHVKPSTKYEPMQMIFCDKRVTAPSGVNAYRVQGTEGWVFDKRPDHDGDEDSFMLRPANAVRTGEFAYEAVAHVAVRNKTDVGEECRTLRSAKKGDLVFCDVVRESPHKHGNGPFVRLSDGSGWLFEKKGNEPMLREIPIKKGTWIFEVQNSPVGLAVRSQPIDDGPFVYENKVCPPKERVTFDRKLESSNGVSFYRIKGTCGWMFDKRGETDVMTIISADTNHNKSSITQSCSDGWSVEFVRGAAAMVEGLEEIMFNAQSRVISFRSEENVRINVYYTTRTVGTAMDHPAQDRKTQLFRKDCSINELKEILQNPRTHTGKGYYKKNRSRHEGTATMQTQHGPGIVVEEEEYLRNAALECDDEMAQLLEKQLHIRRRVREYDEKRAQSAAKMKERIEERTKALKQKLIIAQQEAEQARKAAEQEAERQWILQQAEEERQRRFQNDLTCDECFCVFSSVHAREQHCRDAHNLACYHCGKVCKSSHGLSQHQNATGHW